MYVRTVLCALVGVTVLIDVGTARAQQPPTVTDPVGMVVEEVRFASGDIELAGRLWLPPGPGPHPAAVFLPGSGQSIRNLDLDPDPVPFRFVEQGMAFLAWDKRGVRDSGGAFEPLSDTDEQAQLARLRLLAADGAAAMAYLARRADIDPDRVGAWAFSQGGWVAPLLEEVGARPVFTIVVGGPVVTIGEELAYSEIADAAREASRSRQRRLAMDALYEALETRRIEQGGSFGGYDPLPWLSRVGSPMLYLLGEHDLSVPTRRSIERIAPLSRDREWIDFRAFARANHGVGTRDAAGTVYPAEEFYETQFEFLRNLGILRHAGLRVGTRVVMTRVKVTVR